MNEANELVITEFPAHLNEGDAFRFTHEGATYHATANYIHVFHEAAALADHLRKAATGLYDGLIVQV